MKIVYVVEDFFVCGGVERIVSEKANVFSLQRGDDVTIISVYKDERNESYTLNEGVGFISLDVPMARKSSNVILCTFYRIQTLIKASRQLNCAIKKTNPDIVFFATTLCALLLPFCKTKAKKVFESHSARKFTPYSCLFALMERKADAIVCLTKSDAKEYRRARNVVVIPNFITIPKSTVADYTVKRAIAVGRLEHVKGFDILIDCWKNISEKYPDWQLDIYGEGCCRQSLQNQIIENGLSERIKLCGHTDNITKEYCKHSLCLMTSRYEGLPMALIEAQSCGLPAVTFDFEYGARDIVADGVNGILVEQGNTQLFCEAMEKMMSSAELREKYGKQARERMQIYSKEHILGKWIELISEITSQ